IFTGDRLDEPYRNFPASYPGLIFTDVSKDNVLQYAIIKNAFQGIIVDQPATNLSPKLILNEVIIDNAYDAGIIGINTSIEATNLLVSNCGKNIQLVSGGKYNFVHTTAVSYSNNFIQHREPVLSVANHIPNSPIPPNALDANFINCIFWGENTGLVTNEILLSKQGSTAFNVNFDHVLWRVETNPPLATAITNAINSDPLFDSVNSASRYYDFRLKEASPALNSGKTTSVTLDLDGNTRPVGLPDRGSYEKQ
ncbi:MAG TPA: choice-of-anchor Q domain-containing protein, partial [Chitinophagaceae bacterium]